MHRTKYSINGGDPTTAPRQQFTPPVRILAVEDGEVNRLGSRRISSRKLNAEVVHGPRR